MSMPLKLQSVIVFFMLAIIADSAKSQSNFIWGKQFGTAQEEYVLNHVADQSGNIYVSGKTVGVMDGQNFGKNDGFITKIDSLGNTIWTKQFGTSEDEDILWSALDNKGSVYITGTTKGALADKNFGKENVFVVKYNPEGQMEWAKQFGTDSTDVGGGIYADNKGFIYITGSTNGTMGQASFGKTDGFIMKLDADGNKLFTTQFGTATDDRCIAIAGDGKSTLYVCGSTWGDISGKNKGMIDAYMGSFTDKGEILKFTQFGTDGFDMALQLIPDDEMNVYVGGSTSGNLGCDQIGEGDCFLTKINPTGDIVWSNQFGTKNHDGIRGIAFNKKISDHILVSGILNLPPSNAFIRMYKKDGSLLWERNFVAKGMNGDTSGKDVGMDNQGNIYHLGLTKANLFGSHIGEGDVYLVKLGLDKIFMNR